MIFIGSGSMLTRAVVYALSKGYSIECIVAQKKDISIKKFEGIAKSIILSNNPNQECSAINKYLTDGIIFSINNKFILDNNILSLDADIFNIHNGLVQKYRGIGEVCVYSAICRDEQIYGSTLHKILPNQDVDSGPIISQESFKINKNDNFEDVFLKSIQNCDLLFKKNLEVIFNNEYSEIDVIRSQEVFTYSSIEIESKKSSHKNLKRAQNLGKFSGMMPLLKKRIFLTNQSIF